MASFQPLPLTTAGPFAVPVTMHESRTRAQIELLPAPAFDSVRVGRRHVAGPVGVLNEELIMSIPRGQFALPDKCCMCLGHADTMHECSTPGGKDGQSFVVTFQVPMCRSCQLRLKRTRAAIGLIAAGLIGGTIFAMWAMEGAWVAPWSTVGVVAFMLGAVLLVWLMASQPAVFAEDRVTFRNKEYQRLFDEANRAENIEAGQAA